MDKAGSLGTSPMMLAYAAAEEGAPDHLVLYRVGEFYEVLGRNASTVSRALGSQLTRRRQKDADDVPMCGIPAGTLDQAAARLLAAGHKVAISEQPASEGGERLMRRLTPATSVDGDVIPGTQTNNLTAVYAEDQVVAFAWLDLSTGESGTTTASLEACGPALARVAPSEILVVRWPEGSEALAIAVRSSGAPVSVLPTHKEPSGSPDGVLRRTFGEAWRDRLRGLLPTELTALAALLDYVHATVGRLPDALSPPRRVLMGDTMHVDAATLRGLEVLSSASGRDGSLLSVLDRTVSPAGGRLLARQLAAPLTKVQQIGRRLAMVRFLVDRPQIRVDCREELSAMPDVLRACGRLSLGKGGPRDLAAIRDGLQRAASLARQLQGAGDLPAGLVSAARDLASASDSACAGVAVRLRKALVARPPASALEPDFVAAGFAARVDAARTEASRLREAIEALRARYVGETRVKALRIRINTLIGYHVEVPSAQAAELGDSFILRQGLASSTRFRTAELDGLAGQLGEAASRFAAAEQAVFTDLSNAVLGVRETLTRVAHAAAALDLVAGLAQAAAEGMWTQPELADDATLDIEGGRHPVAERLLEAQGRSFVPNDCRMAEGNSLWLLTGPNMAGKSTFLRQIALIVLMAQLGSFVPASRARTGVVDKLFSRIGASDDLAAGRSTFLVEMLETAAILSQASERSLVILDEVGRGTSTHDGLSIAQATMEHLHDVVRCRTLFATHFHELTKATDNMKHAACMAMEASAGQHDDVFTFKIASGRAVQSYGLKAAALAGMPTSVLTRAEALLARYNDRAPDNA